MNFKKVFFVGLFAVSLCTALGVAYKYNQSKQASADIIKNYNGQGKASSLPTVEYNGNKMFVAKASYYDYYSDSQVGTSSTPGPITDALLSLSTFGKFNKRMMEAMKYNVASECPAEYSLYQGKCYGEFKDNLAVYSDTNEQTNINSNYWVGANHHQGLLACAAQGLVDSRLTYDSSGESHLTQSNPKNGKSANMPLFDKKFLTTTKHENSQLSLGGVKDNFSFPFRTEVEDGVTYYEFESTRDTIRFNSKNQLDYLGKDNSSQQVWDTENAPGLFPENVPADSNSARLNFGYGMKIEVPFLMTKDGKINGKDIVFEFNGDDDVWVFVDGHLALDMGGAHPKLTGKINFAKGVAIVDAVKNHKVAFSKRVLRGLKRDEPYTNAALGLVNEPTCYKNYETQFSSQLKASLADTKKEHVLTLFYLERGMYASNMKMKFNLPEPSKLIVNNKVVTDEVGDTYKDETAKVAAKDNFLYDVVDNTTSQKNEIDLLGGENVAYINEFNLNDKLLVQEKALKNTSRKLTELYSTSWSLSDAKKSISSNTGLVVNDTRVNNKTILFKNVDDVKAPKLNVDYVNKPNIKDFTVTCNVTDKFKAKYTDYKNKEFKYTVSYSDVFGGGSTEVVYKGSYKVYNEDKTTENKTTTDGVITLKPGQKAVLDKIPVVTKLKVVSTLDNSEMKIIQVKKSDHFTYDKASKTTIGKITTGTNMVEYTIGTSDEEEKSNVDIKGNDNKNSSDLVNISGMDKAPKTADDFGYVQFLSVLLISLCICGVSLIGIIKK